MQSLQKLLLSHVSLSSHVTFLPVIRKTTVRQYWLQLKRRLNGHMASEPKVTTTALCQVMSMEEPNLPASSQRTECTTVLTGMKASQEGATTMSTPLKVHGKVQLAGEFLAVNILNINPTSQKLLDTELILSRLHTRNLKGTNP